MKHRPDTQNLQMQLLHEIAQYVSVEYKTSCIVFDVTLKKHINPQEKADKISTKLVRFTKQPVPLAPEKAGVVCEGILPGPHMHT